MAIARSLECKKILVVDDEPLLREILREELEALGAEVSEAANGSEAFTAFQKGRFDAVISDVRMPQGDGMSLLDNIRKGHPVAPVVMLVTGYSDVSNENALSRGASAVFSKPLNLEVLFEALIRMLVTPTLKWTRQHERIGVALDAVVTFAKPVSTQTVNIGQGGLCLKWEHTMPKLGDFCDFQFRFEHASKVFSLEGKGLVRWIKEKATVESLPSFGIEFLSLNYESTQTLNRVISIIKSTASIPE